MTTRQLAMVMDLNKCIGCQTCTVACKTQWTNRDGRQYMYWNNVETSPGAGYPAGWQGMGGGFDAAGALREGTVPALGAHYGTPWDYNLDDGLCPFIPGSPYAWMAEALDRPYPQRTAGAIESLAYEPETGAFTLRVAPIEGVAAPTEIYLPERVYGDGFQVEAQALERRFDQAAAHHGGADVIYRK